jgi:hypothetical protein
MLRHAKESKKSTMKICYKLLEKNVNKFGFGASSHAHIGFLIEAAELVLSNCWKMYLTSKNTSKCYIAFESRRSGLMSSPVNTTLFNRDLERSARIFNDILNYKRYSFNSQEITSAVYTVIIACCSAIQITTKSGRKRRKIIEWFCAALVQAALKVEPEKAYLFPDIGLKGILPADFIFDLGSDRPKLHFPVKISSRDKSTQILTYLRALEGAYGVNKFLAMPIILDEAKWDDMKREVIEICPQRQWHLYQLHGESLWNVCYLDAPALFLGLSSVSSRVKVLTIGDLLQEGGQIDQLLIGNDLRT